jgi:Glyoxalase/Bleomycin resistance protein/Dioxygenase superfamily
MKTHELKSHQSDRELEKLLRGYLADFLAGNAAARLLDEMLRKAGIGIRPLIDHLTFRTHNIDRRAEEFVRYGFEHDETLEYNNWFAKVYRREGYPALFIDQAFPGERGKGSIIPAWVEKFGDRHLHHVAVLVDDMDKAIAAMKESGIAFTGEVVGRRGGALRQIFTQAEMHDNEPFTVLELTERHFGFKGFSPPQAQGLMQSTMPHKKAA